MYKHILLATDGLPLSAEAVLQALHTAKRLDARVTAMTVVPAYHHLLENVEALGRSTGLRKEQFEEKQKKRGPDGGAAFDGADQSSGGPQLILLARSAFLPRAVGAELKPRTASLPAHQAIFARAGMAQCRRELMKSSLRQARRRPTRRNIESPHSLSPFLRHHREFSQSQFPPVPPITL